LRVFGPKREEVAGGWRRLHNEELHNFYTSPNVVRVIKSGRMRWTRHEFNFIESNKCLKLSDAHL